jgi:hypothetical protein
VGEIPLHANVERPGFDVARSRTLSANFGS